MSTFTFDGLSPWPLDSALVECEVGSWWLDLHNFALFLGYTYRSDAVLSLTWYHHQPSNGPPTPNLVIMSFADVRNLRVEQAPDWDVRCSDDTHGWDYVPDETGVRASLSFDVGDSELSFTASGVRLRLVPSDIHLDLGDRVYVPRSLRDRLFPWRWHKSGAAQTLTPMSTTP